MERLTVDTITDAGVKALAYAICIEAAREYKLALNGRKRCDSINLAPAEVYEDFFRSGWFRQLSGIIDGDRAIDYLKQTKEDLRYAGCGRKRRK